MEALWTIDGVIFGTGVGNHLGKAILPVDHLEGKGDTTKSVAFLRLSKHGHLSSLIFFWLPIRLVSD